MSTPAVLGGAPAFAHLVPLVRPSTGDPVRLASGITAILQSGILTNGRETAAFERAAAEYLGVPDAVAVSSCTTGLMLALRCLGVRGSVVVPSFTFMATAHAVAWNGLPIAFADSSPQTCTVAPSSVASALAADSGGIIGVHTYGAPCDVTALEELARSRGIPLILDSAHGFGARYPDGSMVGSQGTVEVFSFSPTKNLTTGEGGLITCRDPALAAELRKARDYGNPGNYDSEFVGLNARMTEIAGLLGRTGLRSIESWLARRRETVSLYRDLLGALPGVTFQKVPDGAVSSYKDLALRIDPSAFGLTRDQLATALNAENISCRSYFDPPVHRQTAYASVPVRVPLTGTDELSNTMITLPLYHGIERDTVRRICTAFEGIHQDAASITRRLTEEAALSR